MSQTQVGNLNVPDSQVGKLNVPDSQVWKLNVQDSQVGNRNLNVPDSQVGNVPDFQGLFHTDFAELDPQFI